MTPDRRNQKEAEGSPSERTAHRREDSVITWLLLGGLLFGVGWLVGVNRLWRSPVWSRSEKLLGTLVVPGGLLWALTLEPPPGRRARWRRFAGLVLLGRGRSVATAHKRRSSGRSAAAVPRHPAGGLSASPFT
jgi:hypothetical protein